MKDERLNPANQEDWFVDCIAPNFKKGIVEYAESKGVKVGICSRVDHLMGLMGLSEEERLYSSVIDYASKGLMRQEISIKDFFARCDAYAASSVPEPVEKPEVRIIEGCLDMKGLIEGNQLVLRWGLSRTLRLTKDNVKALHKFAKKHMR